MFNPCPKVYLIGVHYGHQKPDSADDLLKDFLEEAISLCENSLRFKDKLIPMTMHYLICDAPDKSLVLKLKDIPCIFWLYQVFS